MLSEGKCEGKREGKLGSKEAHDASKASALSDAPSGAPSRVPSGMPSGMPSGVPSGVPSSVPSGASVSVRLAELEKEFREHSIAEFFKKNRQMLGYTGKVRSLTTIIHEAVTNALDACEDAGVAPEICVEISNATNSHYKVVVSDNGTGVPKSKVGLAFGKLLAGTKFHQRIQRRGQQGIGIAYSNLFAQITTGKPMHVKTVIGDGLVYECDVAIDVNRNEPIIQNSVEKRERFKGTRIQLEVGEVEYKRADYGVYEYLRRTALANPHGQFTLIEPSGEVTVFPRATRELPKKPRANKPHPLGVTTSDLLDMSRATAAKRITSWLTNDFSRISSEKVKEIESLCKGIDFNRSPKSLSWQEAEALVNAMAQIKWIAPESDVLVPISAKQIERSLKNLLKPEFVTVVERRPRVFRGGIPFLVEAAIAYSGGAGRESNGVRGCEVMRFANRVPLLFDAGVCAITEAVRTIDWSRYEVSDLETTPITIFVNFTSVHVPYTGAGKLAIACEEEIVEEIRLALMECGRQLAQYLRGVARAAEQERRRTLFFKYIEEVAQALAAMTGREKALIVAKLHKLAEERTKARDFDEAEAEATNGEAERVLQVLEHASSGRGA